MNDELGKSVLKGVSRSFYLTLRLLPAPMREAASVAYLLARSSDTIADTESVSSRVRLDLLSKFAESIEVNSEAPDWPDELLNGCEGKEAALLFRAGEVLAGLRRLPEAEKLLVKEVLAIIISGQALDLKRFADSTEDRLIALSSDSELEDYTWRVAGCVGAFWTKLGFLTLENRFANAAESDLLEKGIAYGKGLQLVNILRDLPRDLRNGRCYLPVQNPSARSEVLAAHARWLKRAREWIGEGVVYAEALPSARLRAATVLPAFIAEETLNRLDHADWETLESRIKIPRSQVYRTLVEAFLFRSR
jgi:farnesyl-diphosphate farnesyltransferase